MKRVVKLDQNRCDRSPFCPAKRACPVKAIKTEKGSGFFGMGGKLSVDEDLCTDCGICVNNCPMGALQMVGR